jgi:hypothetical protein
LNSLVGEKAKKFFAPEWTTFGASRRSLEGQTK